jgi:hypothetical protein
MTARTPEQVRAEGIQALAAALGPDDLVRFLLLFDQGSGDYTAERQAWVNKLDLDTILHRLDRHRQIPEAANGQASGSASH